MQFYIYTNPASLRSITSSPPHMRATGRAVRLAAARGLRRAPQIYNFCNILLRFAFFAPLAVISSVCWIIQFRPQVIFTIINYIHLWTHGSVRKGVRNARHAKTAARHSLPSMWYVEAVFAVRPRTSKCMSGSSYLIVSLDQAGNFFHRRAQCI